GAAVVPRDGDLPAVDRGERFDQAGCVAGQLLVGEPAGQVRHGVVEEPGGRGGEVDRVRHRATGQRGQQFGGDVLAGHVDPLDGDVRMFLLVGVDHALDVGAEVLLQVDRPPLDLTGVLV